MTTQLQKLVLILAVCTGGTCQSADYYFDPRFSATQRFDTNLRMIPHPQQDNWISTFSPSIDLGYRRENGEFKTRFTWNEVVYDNETALNVSEQLVNATYKHATERFNWGMDIFYGNQSNLTSNFLLTEYQPIQLMRKSLTIAPNLSYALTEKSNVVLSYNYTDLSYEKNPNVINLYDYTYHQGSVGLTHMWTERDKLSATISTARLNMPAIPPTLRSSSQAQISQTETIQIGWDHTFNERLIASIGAGINYSQTDSSILSKQGFYQPVIGFDPATGKLRVLFYDPSTRKFHSTQKYQIDYPTHSVWGQIFNVSLQKTFEKGTFAFAASRQLSPTAQGNQEITQLNIMSNYRLNERWQAGLDAGYQMSSFPVASNLSSRFGGNRTYYTVTPKISWLWSPELTLQLSYSYRNQSFDALSQSEREANAVQLQFTYQPQINRQVK